MFCKYNQFYKTSKRYHPHFLIMHQQLFLNFNNLKIHSHNSIFKELVTSFVNLLTEVTKIVYFIGNERMLIAHDSNRLRFS